MIDKIMTEQENTTVKKWKSLLDWTSKKLPPISPEKYRFVAQQLEFYEAKFRKYPKFLKSFIPQVRQQEGNITIEYDIVYDKICVITQGWDENDEDATIAIDLMPEADVSNGYAYKGYYVKRDNEWNWI